MASTRYTINNGKVSTTSAVQEAQARVNAYKASQNLASASAKNSQNSVSKSGGTSASVSNALGSAVSSLSSNTSNWADLTREMYDLIQSNNSASAVSAQKQMDYQTESNRIAMDWSAQEAQKNRDWQEQMSNTAHQREIADLKEAGLNPVLSVMGGSGAYTGSGSTGQAFNSAGSYGSPDFSTGSSVLSTLFGNIMNSALQLSLADINRTNLLDSLASQQRVAGIQAGATLGAAQLNSSASKYSSDQATLRTGMETDNKSYIQQLINQNALELAKYNKNTLSEDVRRSTSSNEIVQRGHDVTNYNIASMNSLYNAIVKASAFSGASAGALSGLPAVY